MLHSIDNSSAVSRSMFRRNDSHLRLYGSYAMIFAVLDRLGIRHEVVPIANTVFGTQNEGDLGGKYPAKAMEIVKRADIGDKAIRVEMRSDPTVRHTGTHFTTTCATAAVDKRLLIFGNSFCGHVPGWGATPNFACIFRAVMFYWSDTIDMDLVDQFQPDVVVYQNCERFLAREPKF